MRGQQGIDLAGNKPLDLFGGAAGVGSRLKVSSQLFPGHAKGRISGDAVDEVIVQSFFFHALACGNGVGADTFMQLLAGRRRA